MDRLSQLPANVFTHIIKYVEYGGSYKKGIYYQRSKKAMIELLCVYNKRWQGIIIRNHITYMIISNSELIRLYNTTVNLKNNKKIYKHPIKYDNKKIIIKQYKNAETERTKSFKYTFKTDNVNYTYLQYIEYLKFDDSLNYFEIPEFTFKLVNLTTLVINDHQRISEIPNELCDLINLEKLALCNLNISSLPDDIHKLSKLISLDIANNRGLSSFPDNFSKLTTLQYLIAMKNSFDNIPLCVFSLTNLITLDFYNNDIHEIPADICKLINLESIKLTENLIGSINPNFYQLKKLNNICLGYNCINYYDQINLRQMNCSNLCLDIQFEDENYILERRDRHVEGIFTEDEDSDD